MKNKKGFSLIELMAVIAIIGIMTAVVIVSLSGNKDKKAVETAAREVASAIREAQNYALTGKGASSTCSGYTFSWNNNSANYGFSGAGTCSTVNYTLKNGVTFTSGNSFSFSFPRADLSISSTTPIVVNKGSNTYYICVYQSGRIEEVQGTGGCP